jgi:DNA-binding GntR family transcriptional regulator
MPSSSSELDDLLAPPAARSLGDDIAERLKAAILSGHFEPGERLGEERLAARMQVSRGPIREALVQLERQGIVVIKRNKGAFVAQLTREDLDEVYTLRRAIEMLAMRLAVERATDQDLQQMQTLVDEIAAHHRLGITEQIAADLDLRFHDLIYQAARHRRLNETWHTIRPQIHILLLSRNVAHEDFRDMVVASHQDWVNAIRARDTATAAALVEEHLTGSYGKVLERMLAREQANEGSAS